MTDDSFHSPLVEAKRRHITEVFARRLAEREGSTFAAALAKAWPLLWGEPPHAEALSA